MRAAQYSPLLIVGFIVALLAGLPVASVGLNLFVGGTSSTWTHLAQHRFPEYILNSLWLCLGVGCGVGLLGVATAWLTAMHDFPGRRFSTGRWCCRWPCRPTSWPTFIPISCSLSGRCRRPCAKLSAGQHGDYWFPDIRTLPGAMLMFVCVLYPYVYLLARSAFLERASGMLEAARTLGMGPWRAFFAVSLPLARPAIVAGVALALMETLADYGTVAYFAVNTFTTGIYRAWFSLGDRIAAAQLAAMLLGFVLFLLMAEKISRGRARYNNTTGRNRPMAGARLNGIRAALAFLACAVPLLLGFVLPAILLLKMALTEGDAQFGQRFLVLSRNSFVLAGITAMIAVLLALIMAYGARLSKTTFANGLNRLVGLGYAVPGAVIAVGVLIPVTRLDNWLAGQWEIWFGHNPGLLLTGGIAALIYAYLARFLGVALHTVETSLAKITPNMDDAARCLGLGQGETLRRVHAPMLRGSLLTAGLLVFVDVMKELPATLVMRPFNFDTLATQTYTLASDERLAEASTAALAIVAVGLLPLIALSRQISAARRN
jgi:iron(III) transport system permease protein